MKCDLEIVRTILLRLEEAATANTVLWSDCVPSYPEQEVAYNMRLLSHKSYVVGRFRESRSGNGAISRAFVSHLTMSGHELLDTIENEIVWDKIKDKFKSKGLNMTVDLVLIEGRKIMTLILDE